MSLTLTIEDSLRGISSLFGVVNEGPPSMKSKGVGVLLYVQDLKAGIFESFTERAWVDNIQSVSDMNYSHKKTLDAITADEMAAGLYDSPHFTEQLVLQFLSWNVVQHRKRHDSCELPLNKGHGRRIPGDSLHVAAAKL
jgi:hypothetical protein